MADAEFLTVEKFAMKAECSVSTIRRYVKEGVLSSVQPGGPGHRIWIPAEALTALVSASKNRSDSRSIETDVAPKAKRLPGPLPRWKNGAHK